MAQKDTLSSLIHGNFAKELSISDGKMPPNALDFERIVIGTFLIDRKGLDHSIDLLTPDVFYDPRHQTIFSSILKLYESNSPIDLMTVIQDLKKNEKLNLAGGDHYIIDLTMGVSSSAHIEYHVRVILEKFILRSLIMYLPMLSTVLTRKPLMFLNCWTKLNNLFLKSQTERLKKDSTLPIPW